MKTWRDANLEHRGTVDQHLDRMSRLRRWWTAVAQRGHTGAVSPGSTMFLWFSEIIIPALSVLATTALAIIGVLISVRIGRAAHQQAGALARAEREKWERERRSAFAAACEKFWDTRGNSPGQLELRRMESVATGEITGEVTAWAVSRLRWIEVTHPEPFRQLDTNMLTADEMNARMRDAAARRALVLWVRDGGHPEAFYTDHVEVPGDQRLMKGRAVSSRGRPGSPLD